MRPAVFLDRDDTLIANRSITGSDRYPGSLFDPERVRLLPGAAEACGALNTAGFALVVVTNQGCVARGECGIEDVAATNRRVCELVKREAGVELDGVYFCPYHPEGTVAPYNVEHADRKPGPGMILRAARERGLDLARSWMIGDAKRDVRAAVAAGIGPERTIVVGEEGVRVAGRLPGTRAAADLAAAARMILESHDGGVRA